jgi:predicted dehydrogenase
MLHIGIVGAENSHCVAIGKLCNMDRKVPCRVDMVWGEKPKFAKDAAAKAQIPTIVRDWREMRGKVDGVMIDHRHAAFHYEVAEFFVRNRVPCFVDKPFTFTLAEGRALCDLARKRKTPIVSFSTIPLQTNFGELKTAMGKLGKVVSFTSTGPVDLRSKYGGVFFYGIHQVDAIVELFGSRASWVNVQKHGNGGIATIAYQDGPIVTMNCVNNGNWNFHWSAVGDKDILDWPLVRDEFAYLTGARIFVKMFETGKEPFPHERLLGPVAILEAMAKSLRRGKPVRVAKLD